MRKIVHVVATDGFGGVERHVCDTATELAIRGWNVTVVGGDVGSMPAALGDAVRWLPGGNAARAFRSLARLGRQDVCHAHMTAAETAAVMTRRFHGAPVVATRHFAARRGSSRLGRFVAPRISARLNREFAVSSYVANSLERTPDAVIANGVASCPLLWRPESTAVLILQRLEREKDTLTGLQAWHHSGLAEDGWSLRVVGDGAERQVLERWVRENDVAGVSFAGWVEDVRAEFRRAGLLLATTTREGMGLGVLEAMAAGVPVVAARSGGHLETVGRLDGALLYDPGEGPEAASMLRRLLSREQRAELSEAGRRLVAGSFSIQRQVDQLVLEYQRVLDD